MQQVFCNSRTFCLSLLWLLSPLSSAVALPLLTDSSVTVLQLAAPLKTDTPSLVKAQVATTLETRKSATVPAHTPKQRELVEHIVRTYKVSPTMATEIVREAFANGQERGLAPELILAIIAVESTFKPQAVSSQGARGLMQVLPRAHPRKVQAIGGVQALFNPRKNIATGSKILDEYLKGSNGNLDRALRRYSGGSRSYHQKVMRFYKRLKRVGEES